MKGKTVDLRAVDGMRDGEGDLGSYIAVSEGICSGNMSWMLLFVHSEKKNLQLRRLEDRRSEQSRHYRLEKIARICHPLGSLEISDI